MARAKPATANSAAMIRISTRWHRPHPRWPPFLYRNGSAVAVAGRDKERSIRIDPTIPVAAQLANLLRSRESGRAAAFAVALDPEVHTPAAPGASTPVTSVAMLVAAAAIAEAPAHRRQRLEKGVDALARLHRLSAAGVLPVAMLEELGNLDLDGLEGDLADDLRLRILVELAKAER